jgi:vacuolar-type H+-ATPase subunit E/Vma4
MAMDDILRALDEQAESDAGTIIQQAKAEAEGILRDAREDADAAKAARLERAHAQVEPRADQLINSARLQNKRDIEAARAEAIEEVFDDAGKKLASIRSDAESYRMLMKALTKEALAGIDGDAEVLVDEADVELARSLVPEGVKVTGSPTSLGGVTVLARAGRVARRNTIEARLQAVRQASASDVAEILFG